MSQTARQALVDGGHLFFQNPDLQRTDLLNESLTKSDLIELLTWLTTEKGYHIEVTAVRSDHHDDGDGPGLHWGGGAIDCWPLTGPTAGAYLDATDEAFRQFLRDVAQAPQYYDTGLGGSSYSAENMQAAGPSAFEDAPVDHVHIGSEVNE
jgi:hypothetical protein